MAQAQTLCASLTGASFLGVVTLHPVFCGLAGMVLEVGVSAGSEALRSTHTLGLGRDAAKVTLAVLGCRRSEYIHKPRAQRPLMQSE